jgi:hypothetical protein
MSDFFRKRMVSMEEADRPIERLLAVGGVDSPTDLRRVAFLSLLQQLAFTQTVYLARTT